MENRMAKYEREKGSLSMGEMKMIYERMINSIGNDSDAIEIWQELVETAVKYSSIRSNWYLMTMAERMAKDENRTAAHNSMIVKFNMLSRYLSMQGKDIDWRSNLGDENDVYQRKGIGDMGCYIAFVESLYAR